MSPVAIVVPAEQVLPVLDGLLGLYETKVETVLYRVREYLLEETTSSVVLRERAALAEIDAAIEQLGWARMPRSHPANLSAELEVVAAAAHHVLAIRANELDVICEDHELPDGDLSPIARATGNVIDAHRLLVSVEAAARADLPDRSGDHPEPTA